MHAIVVGAGTVGKATGTGIKNLGHTVAYADTSKKVLAELREQGETATTPQNIDLNETDAVFISVDAPTTEQGIDATNLLSATQNIGEKLSQTKSAPIIIFRSTQPPGTTRNSLIPLLHRSSGKRINHDFTVTYWPEYLRAEHAEQDFANPRVITIATLNKNDPSHHKAALTALDLETAIHWLPLEAAELQKYVNNVGNAVKISTYNWFRQLAEKIGINPEHIQQAFKLCTISAEGLWNPEYGTKDLGPYSGACLPKDIAALIQYAETAGINTDLLKAAEKINKEAGKT